ncbi:MAG TPA: hypothetical protein PKL38_10100 [Smithella sp.]|nr:hypothetical protein [Smithella sp.]
MKKILSAFIIKIKSYFLFVSCVAAMINIIILTCFAISAAYAGPVFSVTSDNELLSDVLAKVSKSAGYKIEITKGYKNKSLSVSLKKVAIEKGLREIMRVVEEPNYALVVNDRVKKVEIIIFDTALSGQKGGSGTYVGTKANFHKRGESAYGRALVDVSSKRAEHQEEASKVDIAPPVVDIAHPEIEILPPD